MAETEHEVKRRSIIAGLRELADALEQHPELPTPYGLEVDVFWRTDDNARHDGRLTQADARGAMAALPGGWSKDGLGNYLEYKRAFGDHVAYALNLNRADVCKRVQVGVRNVPAHDEPVYEWDCSPGDDEPVTLADHTDSAIAKILGG